MDGLINALNNFLLIGLPYMALLVFLVGSIYKYTDRKSVV